MTEQLATDRFTIKPATEADVSTIGQVHLQSMLETYSNEEAGIDKEWINHKLGFLVKPGGDDYRRKTVREAETNPEHTQYLVAKNPKGQIVGFFHCTRTKLRSKIEAIYLIKEARGQGVADRLMQRGLKFAGDLPMRLEVLDYNQRAISFYQKYGFKIVPNSNKIIRGKLPIITMRRKPTKEINYEV